MRMIVGLGNPGGKYQYTRHNIGFMVVEKLVKDLLRHPTTLHEWKKEEQWQAEICKTDDRIFCKPQTYMNLSGKTVQSVAHFFKIAVEDVWVIHDDIDLPLGKIRIRQGGGSAGHRGIESLIHELGNSDFVRFRLGIGRGKLGTVKNTDRNMPRQEVEKYVVSPFRDSEGGEVTKLIKHAVHAVEISLKEGLEKAMHHFN